MALYSHILYLALVVKPLPGPLMAARANRVRDWTGFPCLFILLSVIYDPLGVGVTLIGSPQCQLNQVPKWGQTPLQVYPPLPTKSTYENYA